jgi:hypothetical protein
LFINCLYMYYPWRYNTCILPLEIQYKRGGLCLSQARKWISNVICHCVCVQWWVKMRGDCSFCWC